MILNERCQPIELLISDVDGVLTDGGLVFDNRGVELKRFHIRDGSGIKLWQRSGGRFALVTGRSSHIVEVRAAELGIELVRQGAESKLEAVRQLLAELRLEPRQVAYVGDDLPDLPALRHVGLAIAVADAASELRDEAHYVTTAGGGQGAVREVIEMILKAQLRWQDAIRTFLS